MLSIKNNKKFKLVITILFTIIILAFLIFFIKNIYKNFKTGNNMSNKSIKEIEEYILNISSYDAEVTVQIESNKNTNKYVISQKYVAPNMSRQIVKEPSNIAGVEIIYDGQNLTINNTRFNLSKIYENYEYIADIILCLESFISNYIENKENSKIYEENNEYVLETRINNNEYAKKERLYIDKNTGNPTKLLIEDINEKTVVYILYNEIKINDLEQNDILAFKNITPYARLY